MFFFCVLFSFCQVFGQLFVYLFFFISCKKRHAETLITLYIENLVEFVFFLCLLKKGRKKKLRTSLDDKRKTFFIVGFINQGIVTYFKI